MTSASSSSPVVRSAPQANVYTALLLVAVVALAVTLGVVLFTLMSPMPKGYGMEIGDLLAPLTGK
jgi:hypothetical protein